MKKFVTLLVLLLCGIATQGFAQAQSVALRATAVESPANSKGIFLSAPKYVKPFSTQANVEGLLYVDTETQQYAYTYFPTLLNLTLQDNSQFVDTILGYAERFTSPFSTNTWLDSVTIGIGIGQIGNIDNNRILVTANKQTVSNGLPYPSALIDSTSLSGDDMNSLEQGTLQFVTLKMNHKKVGRFFFVQVLTAYDPTVELADQNFIGLFGDSLDYPQGSQIDTAVQRGYWEGLHYQSPQAGISRGGADPFYQNFFITAYVSDASSDVAPTSAPVTSLGTNFPNPVSIETQIPYTLAERNYVTIKVYNTMGSLVKTVAEGYASVGSHTALFNASNLANGTYYYTITAGDYTATKSMIVAH